MNSVAVACTVNDNGLFTSTVVVIVTTLSFIPAFGDEDEWHKSTTGITYFVRLVNCEVDDPANSFGDCPHFLKKWDLYWIVGVSLAVIGAVAAGLHLARTLQGWQPWKSEATGRYINLEQPECCR